MMITIVIIIIFIINLVLYSAACSFRVQFKYLLFETDSKLRVPKI